MLTARSWRYRTAVCLLGGVLELSASSTNFRLARDAAVLAAAVAAFDDIFLGTRRAVLTARTCNCGSGTRQSQRSACALALARLSF